MVFGVLLLYISNYKLSSLEKQAGSVMIRQPVKGVIIKDLIDHLGIPVETKWSFAKRVKLCLPLIAISANDHYVQLHQLLPMNP